MNGPGRVRNALRQAEQETVPDAAVAFGHLDGRRGAPSHDLGQQREGDAAFEQTGTGGMVEIVEATGTCARLRAPPPNPP
jgi:hypothetical protein